MNNDSQRKFVVSDFDSVNAPEPGYVKQKGNSKGQAEDSSASAGAEVQPVIEREPSPQQKEQNLRTWIARKESICPYAPGLAKFVYLPDLSKQSVEQNICYFAAELKAFYATEGAGKRVGQIGRASCRERV